MSEISSDEFRALRNRSRLILAQHIGDTIDDPDWILNINSFSDHDEVRKRVDPELELFPTELLKPPLTTSKLDRARLHYREFLYLSAKKWAEQHGNGAPSIGSWALLPVSKPDARSSGRSFRIDLVVDVFISDVAPRVTLWLGEDRCSCAPTELIAVGPTAQETVTAAMTETPIYRRDLIRWMGREKPFG